MVRDHQRSHEELTGTRGEEVISHYSGPSLAELEPYLKEALREWAEISFTTAALSCSHDQVDSDSCAWYHGPWPALRVLDVVSSPAWHRQFYECRLSHELSEYAPQRILICGAADFSVLAFALAASKGMDPEPQIHVIDLCRTPLEACQWYARRTTAQITVHQHNILDDAWRTSSGETDRFHLIITDALLTRFTVTEAESIIESWFAMLRPGGSIITTIRLHPQDTRTESPDDILRFVTEVKQLADLKNRHSKVSPHELVEAAGVYARKIVSHDQGDHGKAVGLFTRSGFEVECQTEVYVRGELVPTTYVQIVARKPS